MKTSSLLQHAETLRRTASVLRNNGYLATQHLPSLKRPFWKVFLELRLLFHPHREDVDCFTPTAVPKFHAKRFFRGNKQLATSHALFFLNREVPEFSAARLLGRNLLNELLDSGILVQSAGSARSLIRFVPWKNFFLLSDPDEGSDRGTDFYVYVGGDSTLLTDFVHNHLESGSKTAKGLDLCAGTSIQSYNLLNHCHSITAAELNPRAVAFAKLSKHINGATGIEVLQSDLWENIEESYDIIVSNPPYLPMPGESLSTKTLDVCGGGELGLDIPLRIIDGLGTHLNHGGYSAVLAASPVIDGKDVLKEDLIPIAEKHGLSVRLHAWKYTNLKLDMELQRNKNISHFVFCVIESKKTGLPSVESIHLPLHNRLLQLFAARLELFTKRR